MNNIKAIIFDYGGVIIKDTDEILIQDIADKFHMSNTEALDIINVLVKPYQRGTISDEEFWKQFSQKAGKILPNGYASLWIDKYDVAGIIDARVIDLVKKLKNSGYLTALLSNTIPPHMRLNQKQGFYDLFDPVLLSPETDTRKPEEKIYQIMLEKINLSPDECVFIDDKKKYVDTALKIGMHGLKFDSYEKLIVDLNKLNIAA